MVVNKPSIYIYVNNPNENVLREICSGIEEEGVFYEIIEREEQDLNTLQEKVFLLWLIKIVILIILNLL